MPIVDPTIHGAGQHGGGEIVFITGLPLQGPFHYQNFTPDIIWTVQFTYELNSRNYIFGTVRAQT